ncbi:light-inducible protein CPRF3-like [Cicer arietinum]|uniref:G-box-binding factor 1-like n=1 Tax=Cicer arietinum TaxID=3827 RepID=A0A1S2Y406_CICAR|nr:G-box-binding factor 1-like [Cicer arietinum]XP_027189258.1 G-box-binding factor 1-like [Cicer arietinum]
MGKEESNTFGRPYNFTGPNDETPNKPTLPHWTTSMQAYYNRGSTPAPFLNQFAHGPYLYQHPYMWLNQANNALLQCDPLHDPAKLSNKPHPPEGAALAFQQIVLRNYGDRNSDWKKLFGRNSQPESSITGESREYGNQSSARKNDWAGTSMSVASGSKRSPDEDQDDSKNDFTISKKQKSNMTTGDENSSGLTQNVGKVAKESDADAQLKNTDDDDIRKERKRQSNRESAKRSRIRKQQECDELCKKVDSIRDGNSALTQMLVKLSEECLELTNENDSIEEELIKRYGPESIADLLLMKPA